MRKYSFMTILLLAAAPAAWAAVNAVTKPSQDVTLSFVRPGQVNAIHVKEGQAVKAGDVLVELECAAEQIEMLRLKFASEDQTKFKAAQEQLAQKQLDYRKIKEAFDRKSATSQEVEHSELDVKIGELSVQLAKFEHEQDIQKYKEAVAQMERMKLRSPFDGKIEKITGKVGESVNALAPVIRVVNTDLVHVEAPVPLAVARGLKVGQAADVEFIAVQNAPAEASPCGRLVHVGAVADSASETLMVRVEVCNPKDRPAGEHVKVTFRPATQPASAPSASPNIVVQPKE